MKKYERVEQFQTMTTFFKEEVKDVKTFYSIFEQLKH